MRMLIVILAVVVAGCSTRSAVTPGTTTTRVTTADNTRIAVETERVGAAPVAINASAARVWELLPSVYAALGLDGQVFDDARRIYGQPQTTVRRRLADTPISQYLNCGTRAGMANVDSYNIRITIRTQVQPNGDDASTIRTQVDASGRSPSGSDHWVTCGTTNRLERRIETMLVNRVAIPR